MRYNGVVASCAAHILTCSSYWCRLRGGLHGRLTRGRRRSARGRKSDCTPAGEEDRDGRALARRLARTLIAMWRDQTDYQPDRTRTTPPNPISEITSATGKAAHG